MPAWWPSYLRQILSQLCPLNNMSGYSCICGQVMSPWAASLVAQMLKNLPAIWETQIQSLGQEDSPGEGNGNPLQYSCLEKPHGQKSLVGYSPWGHRVGHDWATKHSIAHVSMMSVIFFPLLTMPAPLTWSLSPTVPLTEPTWLPFLSSSVSIETQYHYARRAFLSTFLIQTALVSRALTGELTLLSGAQLGWDLEQERKSSSKETSSLIFGWM